MKKLWIALVALAVALASTAASAQEKLIVSVWGGNWKDGAAIIAKEFTKRTGMEVEFITGGTLDRLAKAKIAKIDPELAKLPGIFTTPAQWSTQAIVTPDEVQAKLLPTWKAWFTENMMQ